MGREVTLISLIFFSICSAVTFRVFETNLVCPHCMVMSVFLFILSYWFWFWNYRISYFVVSARLQFFPTQNVMSVFLLAKGMWSGLRGLAPGGG